MTPATFAYWLPAVVLATLLLWAMVTDLVSRRIPNVLVATGIAAAGVIHVATLHADYMPWAGEWPWAPVTGLLTGGGLLLPLYLLRAVGAGDVKLMAMVGAFVGAPAALRVVLLTLLAGGVLSLLFMAARGITTRTLENVRLMLTDLLVRWRVGQAGALSPLTATTARLPYAVAISAGTVMACGIPLVRGWQA